MSISKSPKSQYGQRAVKWLTSYMKSISKYETDPAIIERLARSYSLFTGVPASNIFDFREGQQWFDGDDEPGPTMIALVWNHSGNVIDTEYVMDDSRAAIRYAESVLADRNREVARFALRQVMREPVSFGGSEEQAWNGRHLRAARPNPCGCSARANPRKPTAHRANPVVPCRGDKKVYNRYQNAMVLHNGEWVQLNGCQVPARVPSYHGNAVESGKGRSVPKKAVRQKASRSRALVKGVRARARK